MREKLDDISAMEVLKEALEKEPENEEVGKLLAETKQEYEEDNTIPIDHPER